jgi:hypothetical protein
MKRALVAAAILVASQALGAELLAGQALAAQLLSPGPHALFSALAMLAFVALRLLVWVALPSLLAAMFVMRWRARGSRVGDDRIDV